MTWQPVASSTLAAVAYDASTRLLKLRFKGGAEYTYEAVPPETAEALLGASSAGAYFHNNIKGQFKTSRTG
jgi:hypothetical protein